MSKEIITTEELKALIANGIKQENLHEALPEDAIERIKEKILAIKNREDAKNIPEIVSEAEFSNNQNTEFPEERLNIDAPEQQVDMSGMNDNNIQIAPGSVPAEQPSIPTVGYTPELPEMLKKAMPSELFVFQYTDINENGENLSYKPMRLMEDPDVKKSMQELWIEQGKTKANVYVAKFEKMGEIHFNYTDGISKFIKTPALPDYAGGQEYKENPYAANSMPQIDAPKREELERYIKSSVDLEGIVKNIVMGIIKDSVLTNSERAINDTNSVQEDIDNSSGDVPGYGTRNDQLVKPMEALIREDENLEFNISMKEIVESDSYEKITLPEELNEAIKLGDKKMLKRENQQVQEWLYNEKKYFIPVGRISKDKGYIKL